MDKQGQKCRRRPGVVERSLRADVQLLQQQHDHLAVTVELCRMRRQVLTDTIRDLDAVSHFKNAMSSDEEISECEAQQQQEAASYVVSLLHTVQPEMLQQILEWQAADWHDTLADAAARFSLLLQIGARRDASGAANPYEPTVEQQLCQAVDQIVKIAAVGSFYGTVTGAQLGICTAMNHLTMQPEAPPEQHWQHVLQELQLSHQQLLMLAACYQEFVRQRKTHQQLQEKVSEAIACSNSCTLQVLAAGPSKSGVPAAGASDAQSSPGAGAACRPVTSGDSGGTAAQLGAAPAGDLAAGGRCCAEPDDPTDLMSRLLTIVNESFSMLFLILHNTLTHKQIASMLVASWPFVPRPAPIMEAAWQQLLQSKTSPDGAH